KLIIGKNALSFLNGNATNNHRIRAGDIPVASMKTASGDFVYLRNPVKLHHAGHVDRQSASGYLSAANALNASPSIFQIVGAEAVQQVVGVAVQQVWFFVRYR